MKNKINGIQYLRGYAAILVVLNHLWSIHGGWVSKAFKFDIIGGLGVDIFFVISGFIMACTLNDCNSKNAGALFIKKRIYRIYPLHLLLLTPALLIYFINSNNGTVVEISIRSIIGSLLLIPSISNNKNYAMINPVEWTLVYEMTFYLSLSIFIALTKNKKECISYYSIFVVLMVIVVKLLDLQGPRLGWVNLHYMIGDPIFIDFILGFLVYKLSRSINIKINLLPTLFSLLLISSLGVVLSLTHAPRLVAFGFPSFFIVLLFTLNQNINKKTKSNYIYLSLGNASYSIYLVHHLLMPIYNAIAHKFPSIDGSDIICLLISVASILTGLLIHKYIEKPLYNNWIVTRNKMNSAN